MQPYNHTGLTMGQTYDMGLDWMIGVSNTAGYNAPYGPLLGFFPAIGTGPCGGGGAGSNPGFFAQPNAENYDCDDDKALVYHVGFAPSDTLSLGVNGVWGGDSFLTPGGGSNDDKTGVVDVVMKWDPLEKLSTWINFDYLWLNNPGATAPLNSCCRKTNALGIAGAGRVAITEATGFSLRAEYLRINKIPLPPSTAGGFSGDPGFQPVIFGTTPDNANLWSLTGTLDHSLTDRLLIRGEVRYEQGNLEGNGDQVFYLDDYGFVPSSNHKNYRSYQVLLGVEAVYTF
jgi:hypothetical protein